MSDQFELQLIEDVFEAGGELAFQDNGINRVAYVVHGGIAVGDSQFSDDQSWHGREARPSLHGLKERQFGDLSLRRCYPIRHCCKCARLVSGKTSLPGFVARQRTSHAE